MHKAIETKQRKSYRNVVVVWTCAFCATQFYAPRDGDGNDEGTFPGAPPLCRCGQFNGEPHPPGWYAMYRRDALGPDDLAWWDANWPRRERIWACPDCGGQIYAAYRASLR